MLRSLLSRKLLPPFDASAHLLHGRHLLTYDGRTLALPPQIGCKFTLTADSKDGNFSVDLALNDLEPKSKVSA